MKKVAMMVVMAGVLSFGWTALQADMKSWTPEKQAVTVEKRVQQLTKKLKLTEDQQSQVRTIVQDELDKKRQAYDEANAKLRAVLTPEQMRKFSGMAD